ncbi:MAG: glycosyltransferase family 4 protein [Thermoplasmatales archaeon]|nr:glycosyltransferase family 4 protein [Thermoplasmatales archaeon]
MVGWEFPPFHTGGLGVHSQEISREIARLGHTVVFLTPFALPYDGAPGVTFRSPDDDTPVPPGYPSTYRIEEGVRTGFLTVIERYNQWVGQLRLAGVNVVHVHDWFGTEGARDLAHRLDVPLVMTIHSTELDRSLGHPYTAIYDREKLGFDAATRIIAVSRHLADQVAQVYRADRRKIRVVYNAVRPPDEGPIMRREGGVVLFLGRLTAMKGPDTFLRAAARIAPQFPDVRFAIAGEGPEYAPLVRLSVQLGIGDRVLFFGKISDEERSAILRDAAVFVLPSVVEPFGIVALEAMAAGVPTIVSKTSGVAEVIRSTFQVDFWDVDEFASRMAELLEYAPLREEMSEHAQREATQEGWPDRARQTVEVYREAIREYRGGR